MSIKINLFLKPGVPLTDTVSYWYEKGSSIEDPWRSISRILGDPRLNSDFITTKTSDKFLEKKSMAAPVKKKQEIKEK